MNEFITIFMCGDVMTGRGVDQVLPHAGDPELHESHVKDARSYVTLAEKANGPIPRPVTFDYVWGEALSELARVDPDLRVINLETSITSSDDYWQGKRIHYRMHPGNAPCLTAAGIDCCSLANNHVLDWGYGGLSETLEALQKAGVIGVGAGQNLEQAEAPAVMPIKGKGRVIVFSLGSPSSGIPFQWAASPSRPGVNLLRDWSDRTVQRIRDQVEAVKQPGDVVLASIHWDGNWGYDIPQAQTTFAHKLIDRTHVDVIHGHSSHHVKGIEVYKDRPILYGCGDFLTDYEGIGGYEEYRDDLGLMYFASVDPFTGELDRLQMTPTRIKRFKVNRSSASEARWLRDVLNREGQKLGTRVQLNEDNTLSLQWG